MSNRRNIVFARLRRLSAAEDGFTIVFALILLTLGIAVGAAALADTLSTRSHANLDSRQRRALQAADYGVQEVLYRVNQLNLDSLDLASGKTLTNPICVVHKSNGEWTTEPPTKGGACPVIEEEIGNHDSYQAEFIPNEKVPTGGTGVSFIEPKIVSIGIDDNGNALDTNRKVYARVDAGLSTVEPFKTVEANHDLIFRVPLAEEFNGTARAAHKVFFNGESALTHFFTGTNIKLSGKIISQASIEYGCKPVEYEKGLIGNNVQILPEEKALLHYVEQTKKPCEEPYFKRTPIVVSGSKPNLCPTCAVPPGYEAKGDKVQWFGGGPITLTPGNEYVFCSFWTNQPITLASGAGNASLPVRIFIDNPNSSRCAGLPESTEWEIEPKPKEKVKVKAGSFYAGQGIGGLVGGSLQTLSPSQVQIYLAGNGNADETTFTSSTATENAYLLYAPQSYVNVSALTFAGTLIGYDTKIYATLYTQDLGLNNYPLTNSYGVFHVAGYTQCQNTITSLSTNAEADVAGC